MAESKLANQGEDDRSRFFTPPLWRQRRRLILDTLKENQVTTMIDMGCGEGSVISFLIPCNDTPPLVKLVGVDISEVSLEECSARCKPWDNDFKNLRERPLTVEIFKGSVDSFSKKLVGYDAIVMTEVIEHLYPDSLERFPKVIFGQYKAKLVIISTPNADFNILFPNLNYMKSNSEFRDSDHKFEWTREEFQKWSNAVAEKYGYSVEFTGVGKAPSTVDRHLGFCTQFAIFNIKQNTICQMTQYNITFELQPLASYAYYEFPWFSEPSTDREILDAILEHARYCPPLNEFDSIQRFNISRFWDVLGIRQKTRTLEAFKLFIKNTNRNNGKLELLSDDVFSVL